MSRPPRPYIRSSLRINYNVDANSAASGEGSVMESFTNFLVENGFRRRKVKKRRTRKTEPGKDEAKSVDIGTANEALPSSEQLRPKSKSILIGLHNVLRVISNQIAKRKLGAVLLDAELTNVTAVAQIFALAAFNLEQCPFYVVPNLSSALAKPLNLPRVTALGVIAQTSEHSEPGVAELLIQFRDAFRPIELTTAAAARNSKSAASESANTSTASFATPVLVHPKGKTRTNLRKKKKR